MHFLLSFLFLLSLGCGVLAAPAPRQAQPQSRSFKVERVKRGNTINGPSALRKAYRKYGIVPTSFGVDLSDFEPLDKTLDSGANVFLADGKELDQTGAVSAASVQNDAAFVSPVTVGGQKLVLNFDTGSADFWVMNSELPMNAQSGHTIFNPANSTTFKKMEGATFEITYGDQSFATGGVGTDTVDIGGAVVKNQAIGLPNSVSKSFIEDTYSNGLVGLGFSSLNTVQPRKQKTFLDNIAGSLDEPVLTAQLKSDGVGEYEFGVIDHAKYQGDMINVTVNPSNGFWQFESAYFKVGKGSLQTLKGTPTAIADTGTSLMLLSDVVVDSFYAQVPGAQFNSGAGGYIYPCGTELPSLAVAVGAKHLATVPGTYLNFAQVGTNTTTGKAVCYGGVQSNQGSSLQILGDSFLKAFFVVFDMRGPSIGLASPV
ncbi:pepsin-like aspartic protease [Aspergillus clavatus NRRL 1]|uniref:Extracellular aspartic endopeptidase, putative n=1 Tax=Aspergillus clavatus (strain ATCC 1007 / CBS 513.65 / DSM 816 / NCTC 3887 / NRRL 1 / QM 1276 / 107) TaxID=344612 RepID=A1C7T3_ASPCL|nr:extracellular aspartic endopeptidase, putative [Aspergillus clavatus NRRL 1]EAW14454.1 extracellular aspartic endopeptidase, putative [Aspergillus clavatus NRRL 1]